jgi:hypothetical protein
MAAYLVTPAAQGGTQKAKAMVVSAADATNAKAICAAYFGGDNAWSAATATLIDDVLSSAAAALTGFRFGIDVSLAGANVVHVEVTATDTDNTLDEIAALLVTALNATAPIAGAAYNATTQVLKVAETTDALGAHTVTLYCYPPSANDAGGQRRNAESNIPGFWSVTAHEGSSGAALTLTFAVDGYVVPRVVAVIDN